MSVLWIDASAGLAGDMLVGALLDAGGRIERIASAAAALGLEVELSTEQVRRGGFGATKFHVGFEAERHQHTHWSELRGRIEAAGLSERTRARSLAVFGLLAKAEARVHGVAVEDVSFHEVGAVDSLVDIVGACVLLETVEMIVCSPLPAGGGFVQTEHGRLAVPAPATVGVLAGWPMVQDGRDGELVTPTGAALVSALATCGSMPSMTLRAQGYGAGTRDPEGWSNTVRVVLGDHRPAATPTTVEVLEAQVDDLPGEQVPPLIGALLEAGALDAWATPILMKKGRPGLLISALSRPADCERCSCATARPSGSVASWPSGGCWTAATSKS